VTAVHLEDLASSSAPAKDAVADPVVVHLHAGQLFASAQPCILSTVLGSCVAVCLIDSVRSSGGANHYLLPMNVVGSNASARFGNVAIDQLIAKMLLLGSRRHDLQAKVFGGATTFARPGRPDTDSLGWQNVVVARRVLAAQGIPVVAEDVGGARGRKLLFRTDEGHAWIRRL
jgi:chemotaxis protein CheD